ncbi:hypothetical protein COCVIDRAFT_17708 [Bipolaris victoriae FI3]|uniref:Uncharacterized protein n=2 Tax=Bipolaris TaxID=33194 RepID=W6XL34_COCC2|nr:uncharacterized protein COCCADRAFT_30699 [Bipolaris zeicola 26-R-13]XP_014554602.1 hypothetical protein COCVIDRAFT_17708 [Bipolaris victoriae FI3]EUC27942.1 hypothetical protein COCCADRAFT_30699 [Bipolaris zeicola 26-R-13]
MPQLEARALNVASHVLPAPLRDKTIATTNFASATTALARLPDPATIKLLQPNAFSLVNTINSPCVQPRSSQLLGLLTRRPEHILIHSQTYTISSAAWQSHPSGN